MPVWSALKEMMGVGVGTGVGGIVGGAVGGAVGGVVGGAGAAATSNATPLCVGTPPGPGLAKTNGSVAGGDPTVASRPVKLSKAGPGKRAVTVTTSPGDVTAIAPP
jgi:hypothetical protein